MLRTFTFFSLGLVASAVTVRGDVRMPAIFGDHMVLQQDRNIPVSGWADPGEAITATLGANKATATASFDGKWRTEFPAVGTQTTPISLTVSGKNTLTFTDVVIGDVWVASGQSNMEFPLKMAHNAANEVPQASDAMLRFFYVPRRRALHPLDDIPPYRPTLYDGSSFFASNGFGLDPSLAGKWMLCTPQTAANISGVAYFFGKDLRSQLNRPIGLIGSYYGGSPVESWTSPEGMWAEPVLHWSLSHYQQALSDFGGSDEKMEAEYEGFHLKQEQWNRDIAANPVGVAWQTAHQAWVQNLAPLQAAGKPIPPEPNPPPIPQPKEPSTGYVPTLLYNGMIAPLFCYGIKGVIWYQGESNANAVDASRQYRISFARMIIDWREKWGEGDFPFLYVQLAGNNAHPKTAGDVSAWANMRETQEKTLALPNTGMALATDIGMTTDIHPPDKQDVGRRLALVARRVAYRQDVLDSGPIFQSEKFEGNKVRIAFSAVGSGLIIGTAPWVEPGSSLPPADLTGFAVAGEDKKWFWATAKIEGNEVVVSCDQVPQPVAVRYGWADNPVCNLYNKEGLPAWPFRTDNWD